MNWRITIILSILVLISCEKDIRKDILYGYFIDDRDSIGYSTVTINDQTWMSENLAFLPKVDSLHKYSSTKPHYYLLKYTSDTVFPATQEEYHHEFGALYNLDAALSACPEGRHLPSDDEWKSLERFIGMKPQELDDNGWRTSGNVDIKLKSTSGWEIKDNGNNISGLNVRPAAYTNAPDDFGQVGASAFFWSSTKDKETGKVWFRGIKSSQNGFIRFAGNRSRGLSVRCIKDN